MATQKSGDKAPGFSLKDQDGATVKLSDFKGKKLLLYFYPKASTSGCTTQSRNVSEALPELSRLKAAAMGISPDEPKAQKKFDKSMYGKKFKGIIRSAFLIDEKGKIAEAWYKISPKDTAPKALEAIQQ